MVKRKIRPKFDEESRAFYQDNTPDMYALGVVLAEFALGAKRNSFGFISEASVRNANIKAEEQVKKMM